MRPFFLFAVMALGLAMFTLSATADSEDSVFALPPGSPRIVEVSRIIPGPDGLLREVTAWVDTDVIDGESALASLVPGLEPESEVSAAYSANKRWDPADVPVVVRYNDDYDPSGLDGATAANWAMSQWNAVQDQTFQWQTGRPDGHLRDLELQSQ